MNWLRFSIILGTLFIIAYIIFAYAYKPWSQSPDLIERGPIALNQMKTYPFAPALMPADSYTVSFFLYPAAANKTGASSSSETMFSVFNWDRLFSLQLMPQSRANSTQLSVNTISGIDIMPLPALPLQKWTYISVIIEGRRIDVVYNGRIVGSKIFDSMLNNPKAGKLTSGNPSMIGQIAYVSAANRRLSTEEIMIEYVSNSNTRGEPNINGLPAIGQLFSCPAGAFCIRPATPPNRASSAWYTPFN